MHDDGRRMPHSERLAYGLLLHRRDEYTPTPVIHQGRETATSDLCIWHLVAACHANSLFISRLDNNAMIHSSTHDGSEKWLPKSKIMYVFERHLLCSSGEVVYTEAVYQYIISRFRCEELYG